MWAILARRAAGIFPRGQKGADLVISILVNPTGTPEDAAKLRASSTADGEATASISMMLIQVKNRDDTDSAFPVSAIKGTRPVNVFKDGTPYHSWQPDKVLRMHFSLRGAAASARFYVRDDHTGIDAPTRPHSYVLCIQNLCE